MPGREDVLLGRCIPSVRRQDYAGPVDHVIVSDRNPGLRDAVEAFPVTFVEVNDTWRSPLTARCTGSWPWRFGSRLAHGEFVAFLGDDDEFLPHHLTRHVDELEAGGADFSVSRVAFYLRGAFQRNIGDASFAHGLMDTTGIVCRRHCLAVACWDIPGMEESAPLADAGDFRMVRDWQAGGLRGAFVDEVTGNHHDGWMAR